jgi:hypothetical protein
MADAGSSINGFAPLDRLKTTTDRLTGRAGLSLFSRYLRKLGIFPFLERLFGSIRKSSKGLPVPLLFHQLFCFFLDGTNLSLTRFDELAEDGGYAGAIEVAAEKMASSHQVKRFFQAFSFGHVFQFRRLLHRLFLWRLELVQPEVVILGMDSMVLDNSDAERREGVDSTYKGVAGFHPFQITWRRLVVDAVFRGGSKHSNEGKTAHRALRHLVPEIREVLGEEVPIVVRMDAGFFDQTLYATCEELGIGYVSGGRMYGDLEARIEHRPSFAFRRHESEDQAWRYLSFFDRRDAWDRHRRALFLKPVYEGGQKMLDFARPERLLYTNLGTGGPIDDRLKEADREAMLRPGRVITCYHGRGRDELVHRALKDFGTEQLPFRRFDPNAAFFYVMLASFNLHETFKEDGLEEAVPLTSYATRLRRQVVDIAGKIIRTSGDLILKVPEAVSRRLDLRALWEAVADPPRFAPA